MLKRKRLGAGMEKWRGRDGGLWRPNTLLSYGITVLVQRYVVKASLQFCLCSLARYLSYDAAATTCT